MVNLKDYIIDNYDDHNDDLLNEGNFWPKLFATVKGDEETLDIIKKSEEEMKELAKQQKEKDKEMKERIAALKAARKDEKKQKKERVAQATLIAAEYTRFIKSQENLQKYLKQAKESDDEVMKTWKKGKDAKDYLDKINEKK